MSINLLNVLPGPICGHRSNNPHPRSDFLMPKNLVEQDREQILRNKVQNAVHTYMDKMIRSGRDPMKQRSITPNNDRYNRAPKVDLLEGFVKPTLVKLDKVRKEDHKQLKRERGNSYKEAAKTYHEVPEQEDDQEIIVRIPAKLQNSSKSIRFRVVHKPDAPPGQWVANTGNVPGLAGLKRTHTPPTPPVGAARKHVLHRRSKSAPLLDKADSEDDSNADDWEDVEGSSEADIRGMVKLQRPKTAGPVLTQKMMVHPRMKSWMEGATDYEKEVAFHMLKTLNGGEKPQTPEELRPTSRPSPKQQNGHKANRIPSATHFYVPPSPAPKKPIPEREGKMDATAKEWMRQVEQKIERSEAPLPRNYTQKIELRPPVRRQPISKSLGDYTHENSFFRWSQPSYRRSFVIAPDWVSETLTRRRAQKENAPSTQLRYGSC
ncbi:uncharacterized protein [Asterias amurensis]|uniref:uncharacterized protein isoform X2 n=1 Tax=Asterias amurensis TaxID=7602 RepID=UPI003AB2F170